MRPVLRPHNGCAASPACTHAALAPTHHVYSSALTSTLNTHLKIDPSDAGLSFVVATSDGNSRTKQEIEDEQSTKPVHK